jgi:hypothetical protein
VSDWSRRRRSSPGESQTDLQADTGRTSGDQGESTTQIVLTHRNSSIDFGSTIFNITYHTGPVVMTDLDQDSPTPTRIEGAMIYFVGTDTGGTFTDTVLIDETGAVTIGKRPRPLRLAG